MDDISAVMTATVNLFKIQFTIYGFTFSLWEVFLFSMVAGIVAWIIGRFFSGE